MTAVPINLMDMKDICIKFDTDKHTCNQTLAYNLWFDFITLFVILLIPKWVDGIMIMNFMIKIFSWQ